MANDTIPKPATSGATDFPDAPQSDTNAPPLPEGYERGVVVHPHAPPLPEGYARPSAPALPAGYSRSVKPDAEADERYALTHPEAGKLPKAATKPSDKMEPVPLSGTQQLIAAVTPDPKGAIQNFKTSYREDKDSVPKHIAETLIDQGTGLIKNLAQISAPGIATSILNKQAPKVAAHLPKIMTENATPVQKLPNQIVENYVYGGGLEGFTPETSVEDYNNHIEFHEQKVAEAQKELEEAKRAAEPYKASLAQGINPPKEVQGPIEKAQTRLNEAIAHRDIAREELNALLTRGAKEPSPEAPTPDVPVTAADTTGKGFSTSGTSPPTVAEAQPENLAQTLESTKAAVEPLIKEAKAQEPVVGKPKALAKIKVPESAKPVVGTPENLVQVPSAEVPAEQPAGFGRIGKVRPVSEATPTELIPAKPTAKATPEAKLIPEREPGLMSAGEEGREPAKTAEEYTPAIQQKVTELSDENLRKLAKAHDVDPDKYDFKARDERRHRVERDQLVNAITEKIGEDEKLNLGRASESAEKESLFSGADVSAKGRAARAAKVFPRLRGPVDEFGNSTVGGGSPEGDLIPAKKEPTPEAQSPREMNPKALREWLKYLWQNEEGTLKVPESWKGTPEEYKAARSRYEQVGEPKRPEGPFENEGPWKTAEGSKPLIAPANSKWQNATDYYNSAEYEEHNLKVQKLVDKGTPRARAEQIVTDAEKELVPTRQLPEQQPSQEVKDLHDDTLTKIARPNSRFSNAINKTLRAQGVPEEEVNDLAMDVIADFIEAVRIGESAGEVPGVKTNLKGGFRLPEGQDGAAAVGKWLNTNARNAAIDWMREGSDVQYNKASGQPRRVDDVVDSVTGNVIEHGTGRTLKSKPSQLPEDSVRNPRTGKLMQRNLLPQEAEKAEALNPVSDTKLQARALREYLTANPKDVEFLQEVQDASGHGAAAFDPNFKLSRENAAAIGEKFGISAVKVRERLGDITRDVQSRFLGDRPTPKPVTPVDAGPTRSGFGRISIEKPPAVAKPTETYGHAEGFARGTEKAPTGEVQEDLGAGRTLPLTESLPVGKSAPLISGPMEHPRSTWSGDTRIRPNDLEGAAASRERIASARVQEAQHALDKAETPLQKRRAKAELENAKDALNLIRNKPVSGGSHGATTINGSGESSASSEAINRTRSEKTQGLKRIVIDTRSGAERPLIGPEAVDYQPRPYESVEFQGGNRDGEVIAQGSKARLRGFKKILQ